MLKIIDIQYTYTDARMRVDLELEDGAEFSTDCGMFLQGVSAEIARWNFNAAANIAFITAYFPAPLLPGTVTILTSNGTLETVMSPAVPSLFYTDADLEFDRNIDARKIWKLLGDFWRLFEDNHIVENIWGGYIVVSNEFYRLLDQVNRAKYINELSPVWTSNFALFGPMQNIDRDTADEKLHPDYPNFRQRWEIGESPISIPTLYKFAYRWVSPDDIDANNAYINANDPVLHTQEDYLANVQLVEGRDYVIYNKGILFRDDLNLGGFYWAPWSQIDTENDYRNFGFFFNCRDRAGEDFHRKMRAMILTMWRGASVQAIKDGINIIMDGNFTTYSSAKVIAVTTGEYDYSVGLDTGETFTSFYAPDVAVGDVVNAFQPLFKTCSVSDRVNDYEWFDAIIERSRLNTASFDEGKSLDKWNALSDTNSHLKYHKFRVTLSIITSHVSYEDLKFARLLLNNVKPPHTLFDLEAQFEFKDRVMDTLEEHENFTFEFHIVPKEILLPDPCLDTDRKLNGFGYVYALDDTGVTL